MSSERRSPSLFDAWTESSAHVVDSVVAANRAAFAAFGVPTPSEGESGLTTETSTAVQPDAGPEDASGGTTPPTSQGAVAGETDEPTLAGPAARIEADEALEEWTVEVSETDRGALGVGDTVTFAKTLSDRDVRQFAAASGDTNPLHLDDDYASKTRFKGRIAHGTLVGGLISAALARLPGLTIYLSQDLEFHNPVRIDERLVAEVEIVEDLGDEQYRLTTRVKHDEEIVIDGEAVVLIDDEPDDV